MGGDTYPAALHSPGLPAHRFSLVSSRTATRTRFPASPPRKAAHHEHQSRRPSAARPPPVSSSYLRLRGRAVPRRVHRAHQPTRLRTVHPRVHARRAAVHTHPGLKPRLPPMTSSLAQYYRDLLTATQSVANKTFDQIEKLAAAHQFIEDLHTWHKAISPSPESHLILLGGRELQFSCLSLVSGLYRQAFSALRLSLELSLSVSYYSAHRLELAEWTADKNDVRWGALIDESNGILSSRFATAFFKDLQPNVSHYHETAKKIYRELSEFVHGNAGTWTVTPSQITYNHSLLELWSTMFQEAAETITFSYCLRFLRELPAQNLNALESAVLGRVQHISPIRDVFSQSRS